MSRYLIGGSVAIILIGAVLLVLHKPPIQWEYHRIVDPGFLEDGGAAAIKRLESQGWERIYAMPNRGSEADAREFLKMPTFRRAKK